MEIHSSGFKGLDLVCFKGLDVSFKVFDVCFKGVDVIFQGKGLDVCFQGNGLDVCFLVEMCVFRFRCCLFSG